jgi:acyl-CoA thioester hydrolase
MPDNNVDLRGFPVIIELPVLWGDMDPFQHVNNVVYFRYLESARVAYADRIALYQLQQATGIGPILAATSCDFIRPLRYPDSIRVGCRTVHLTEMEIRQEHAIFSERQKRIVAIGTATVMAYDYRSLRRAIFPQELLECVVAMENGLQISSA